jgi:predicted nucleic acid-binding protein
LDANILVAILNKEYPLFSNASRILSLTDRKDFEVFTSPICHAIAFYFAEKKSGSAVAAKKIAILASHINIAPTGRDAVLYTLGNKKILDFEDGLEYYSALESGCKTIITEDIGDYYFSDITVCNCQEFIKNYL